MVVVPNRVSTPLTRNNVDCLNKSTFASLNRNNVSSLNHSISSQTGRTNTVICQNTNIGSPGRTNSTDAGCQIMENQSHQPASQSNQLKLPEMTLPEMRNILRKGQKTSLVLSDGNGTVVKACFGWNIKDARCDVDASAFLLSENGRVPGDDWFVFYGQTESPDRSVSFAEDRTGADREIIKVALGRLNSAIQKIVFVLTINEAHENKLNFSMLKDAYIRLIDAGSGQELVSYQMEEYFNNVTSVTIGELYLHNGQWKFNPVGNGVNQDLAGQCAIYGVQIS